MSRVLLQATPTSFFVTPDPLPGVARLLFCFLLLLLVGLSAPIGAQLPGSGDYGGSGGSGGSPASPTAAHWQEQTTLEGVATFFPNVGPPRSASWSTGSHDDWLALENNQVVYGNGSVTLETNGVYHIKYVWVPTSANEPAPQNVILQVMSRVDWHGPANRSDGAAENGLGTQQIVAPDHSSGYANETKYFVMNSASGVMQKDVIVNSIVHAFGQNTSPYSGYGGSASVSVAHDVRTEIYNVTLNLRGVTPDMGGKNNILIGQMCAANVITTAPVTITNYHWSVSGQTFAAFFGYEDQSHGYVTPVAWATWDSSTPAWYWSDESGDDKTVSYFADVYYNGQSIGALSDSKTVKVQAPTYDIRATTTSVSYTSGQADVIAATSEGVYGITYEAWAQTPDLFGRNSGYWAYLQLCSLNRVVRYVPPIFRRTNTAGWLDKDWPYGAGGRVAPYNADGITVDQFDEPSESLGNGAWQYYVGDSLNMYEMYLPPGVGAQWVPLKKLDWGWTANGSRNPFNAWSPDPPEGSITAYGSFDTREHPHWDHVFSGTGK